MLMNNNLEFNYKESFIKSFTAFDKFKWIGGDAECASPIITRTFFANGARNVTLCITACGFFDVRVNGRAITEYRFLPVLTDFEKRDFSAFLYPTNDSTTNRLYCYQFDITEYIIDGDNLLEIQLASGWYKQTERCVEGKVSFGDVLKTIYSINITDSDGTHTIGSDGSESWRDSVIRYSQIFIGERIDLTATLSEPSPVIVRHSPKTELCEARGIPDKEIRKLTPTHIYTVDGIKVYDVGENISGVVRVRTTASSGSKIVLRFAESLNEDRTLDFISAGGKYTCASGCKQIMCDEFITDGGDRIFEPRFVWHAFRYFEVAGEVDEVEVIVIHADTPVTAEFNSSSEGLNYLFDAYLRTQLNNMHSSFPSDCPHRERIGYTGDGQVCAPAAMMLLDCREFYEKWIQDIVDCQDPITGHVQHTAPFMGGGGGPGGWGSAILFVPYAFYKQYGDRAVLERCYEPMKKWIGYLCARSENGLITCEEQGGWCLGDWCTLEAVKIPEAYVNTCYFIKNLLIIENIAGILGRESDIQKYESLRKITENALINTYRDKDEISFVNGVQGADAYALWCGLAGDQTAARLAEKYEALGHFDTGFLGTDILLEVLFEYGYADVALKLLESEELGSFLYMKRHGATTIWENWNGRHSQDHPMFGACVLRLFTSILGIKQVNDSCGYEHIAISPVIPKALERASGSIVTPRGRISVSWEKKDGELVIKADAPDGVIL